MCGHEGSGGGMEERSYESSRGSQYSLNLSSSYSTSLYQGARRNYEGRD